MVNYTKEQEAAINTREKDILVSASAGSGKTMVLAERVIKLIKDGTSLDNLLVITFTKAAANEMKERIKRVLNEEIAQNNSRELKRELLRAEVANISTIDSFCLDVVHRFYYVIGLDPSFSVLTDETQAALLKEKALRELEKKAFSNQDNPYRIFYDNFAGDRDANGARELLLDLYNYAMARPDYDLWLDSLAKDYELADDLSQAPFFVKVIKPYLSKILIEMTDKVDKILADPFNEATELEKIMKDFLSFSKRLAQAETSLENGSFDQIRASLQDCQFTENPRKSPKWDEDILDRYASLSQVRTELREQVKSLFAAFFVVDNEEQTAVMKQSSMIIKAVCLAEKELIATFNSLKRKQNLLDYSDMEQLAYQILTSDTTAGHLARQFYQNKFTEILVDEYQDINKLQERIIQLMKCEHNNLFMVGDVKQSIYGFRQADPSLFLNKYQKFAEDSSSKRIVLADNFRSTKPVTKIVNKLFNPLLTPDFGGIDYQNEGQLKFGASYYPDNLPAASELLFYDKSEASDESNQIQLVINRIKQLIDEGFEVFDVKTGLKRPIEFSDIAILTRSRSQNLDLLKQFAQNNIPLFVSDVANYFQTFELTIIMSYLKIVDNPDQDIPLVAVLRSPVFNFKEPDLAKIRIKSPNMSFYSALTNYVSENDELSKRIKDFLNQLADLRDFALNHRISETIWSIYARTSLLEIVTSLPNGKQRRINLENLYERANSYESAGFKGLYQFINFINRMRKNQKDLAQPLLSKEAENSVQLMTIHASKGLEFPVVFYLGLEHQFQKSDLSGNYIISGDSCGITVVRSDWRIDSLVKAMGNVTKQKQLLEEEARIMYVAVTRARQKLILVTNFKDFAKDTDNLKASLANNGSLTLTSELAAQKPADLLLPQLDLAHHFINQITDLQPEVESKQDFLVVTGDATVVELAKETNMDEKGEVSEFIVKNVKKLYEATYPFKDATTTTAYQSVSELKKAFNDPIDDELANSRFIKSANRYLQDIDTRPGFLFEDGFTGAEIGTAMHLILQFFDYQGNTSVEAEIERLVQSGKLNSKIVPHLPIAEITWFVNSDFAKKFWNEPGKLKREVSFSSLLPAADIFTPFSDPNAKILVHGTVDGYYLDDDGIILFDYKTDYVNKNQLAQSINKIKDKYTGQLRLYERALNQLGQEKVKSKYLILLDAQKIVEVK